MKLSGLKTNSAREEQGAWVDNIPDLGDIRLKVRGDQNADARALRAKLFEAVPRSERPNGRLTPKAADELGTRVMVDTILVDWSGLVDEADEPIPYSVEKATEILSNPDFRVFRDGVAIAAQRVGQDGEDSLKAASGN